MNQTDTLLKHMVENDHITAMQAIGLYRVGNIKGRISELRDPRRPWSWDVITVMMEDPTGKKYARYSLPKHEKQRARVYLSAKHPGAVLKPVAA